MSYILDALRRADAERQRGAVPGLHAQPMAGVLTPAAVATGAPIRRLGWAALALALLGLAVAGGWLLRPTAAPGLPAAVQKVPAMPPGRAAAPIPGLPTPPTVALASPPPAQGVGPGAGPSAAPTLPAAVPLAPPGPAGPTPTPRAAQPLPAAVPVQPAASAGRPVRAASRTAPAAEPAPAPAQPAPAAAPARLPSLAELPEAQKREVGPLVVGGAMHAEQAALRIVILNGQVFHEGDKLGPDLQVQQIRLKSVVLSHRGQRFELPF